MYKFYFQSVVAIFCISLTIPILIGFSGCSSDDLGIMDDDDIMVIDTMMMDTTVIDTTMVDTLDLLSCFEMPIDTVGTLCEHINVSSSCHMVLDYHLMITENAKEYLPQFCLEINDSMAFVNQNEELIYFKVIAKERSLKGSSNHLTTNDFCDSTNTSLNLYCANNEIFELTLYCSEMDYKFGLILSTIMDNYAYEGFQYGMQLSILRYNIPVPTSGAIGRHDFRKIIEAGDLSFSAFTDELEYDNISLNSIDYENVFSNTNPVSVPEYFQFYYTKENGLVAFIDFSGNTWTIQ